MISVTIRETTNIQEFESNGDYIVFKDEVKVGDFYIADVDCVPECCSSRNWIIICNKCDKDIAPKSLTELPVDTDWEDWELHTVKYTVVSHNCQK